MNTEATAANGPPRIVLRLLSDAGRVGPCGGARIRTVLGVFISDYL